MMDKESLKTAASWTGGVTGGVGVPAWSFFTSFPPPLFPAISAITGACAAAILIVAGIWRPAPARASARLPPRARWGAIFVASSIPLLIVYVLLLQFTTIRIPPAYKDRLQLGFGMADWTLTPFGQQSKATRPSITPEQLMKNEGYSQDRVQKVWREGSIYTAGLGLILLYFLSFSFWSTGFALLAKRKGHPDERKS